MEDWRTLVPDLGNIRGRITQFKQTLYLYWQWKAFCARRWSIFWWAWLSVSKVCRIINMNFRNYSFKFTRKISGWAELRGTSHVSWNCQRCLGWMPKWWKEILGVNQFPLYLQISIFGPVGYGPQTYRKCSNSALALKSGPYTYSDFSLKTWVHSVNRST